MVSAALLDGRTLFATMVDMNLQPALSAALSVAVLATPAYAVRSDWADLGEGQLRLLAERDGSGAIHGGVEIALEPGWHTYWRYPGVSGIPPRLDFADSENVRRVTVSYPVPERYDDGTGISLIYRDSVVFPFVVEAADPEKPVSLRLGALLGVCREICIPAEAEATVAIPLKPEADPLTRATLESAGTRIPGVPEKDRFAVETAEISGGSLRVSLVLPGDGTPDLFVEPPEGWFVAQPVLVSGGEGHAIFDVPLGGGVPKGESAAGKTFRFLAVAGPRSFEQSVALP
jgi:DsbC/DsbD-like thiol-disulfide interchange protein